MPVSRVTRTAYGADAIAYCRGRGKGHNGELSRNLYVGAVNMLPDGVISFEDQMRIYWDRASIQHTTQCDRFMISFGPDELSKDDPEDVETAAKIGREFALANMPDCQSAIFVQGDGKGGMLHVHIITNDTRMTDCRGLERGAYFHPHFSKIIGEICAKYIKPKEKTLEPERVNKTVQGMRDRNEANRRENETIEAENEQELRRAKAEGRRPEIKALKPVNYIWLDDLKERIRAAASRATDEDSFAHELRLSGVELVPQKQKDGTTTYRHHATRKQPEHFTFELVDLSGFPDPNKLPINLRAKSFKLGANYQPEEIAKLFKEQPQAVPKTIQIKFPPEPPGVPPQKTRQSPEQVKAKPPEKPKEKQESQELAQARRTAKNIIWPQYAASMGWSIKRPKKIIDGQEQEDENERKRRGKLLQNAWVNFEYWRVDRRAKLKDQGKELAPIYSEDKSTGVISVIRDNLMQQFADYLNWLAVERQRKKIQRQGEAMMAEFQRGDRGYGDD